MLDRISCLVPFCRRTGARKRLAAADTECICAKHWSALPPRARAVYRRARADQRRLAAVDEAACARLLAVPEHWLLPEQDPIVVDRLRAAWNSARALGRCWRLWDACRRRAIEAAGGIG